MTALTDAQRVRLRYLVERSYTLTTTTTGGIDRRKTAKQREIEKAEAQAVIAFAVDHVTDAYLAPAGLWSELVEELIAAGTLERRDDLGLIHRRDRWLATLAGGAR